MSSLICTAYHVVYAPAGVVDLLACLLMNIFTYILTLEG